MNRRSKFYQSFNSIFSRANKSGDIILLSLLNSFCLPCLYYGLEPFDMNVTTGKKLNVPLKRAFNKIFGVYDNNTVNHCMYYCGLLPAPLEITFRIYKFLCKAKNSPNLNLRLSSALNETDVDEILSRYGSGVPMSFNELRKQLFSNFLYSLDQIQIPSRSWELIFLLICNKNNTCPYQCNLRWHLIIFNF